MNRTLREWRRRLELSCIVVTLSLVPAAALAEDAADAPAAQAQPVDAAAKKLMAANGLFQRSLFKLAAQQYADFLTTYPQSPQVTAAQYALAVCHYRLGEYDKASELIAPVLHDPKFEQKDEALAVLGYCQLSLKQYDKALASFDELLKTWPAGKHAESAALYRGQALYLSGNAKDAAVAFERFVQQYPKSAESPTALYFLALSQRALNDNGAAVATLAQLASGYPNSRYQLDATLLAGQALEAQGKLAPAIEQYRAMLAAAPQTRKPDAHYSLGVALYKANQFDEAARELTSVVKDFPASTFAKPANLQLGLVQLAGGKVADARATLSAVAQDDAARAPEARYGLAQCDIAEKKWAPARDALQSLAQLQPPLPNLQQIKLDSAVCLMELGKFEEAAGEFDAFATQNPSARQFPEALYRRAFCLHRLGRYEPSHALCVQMAKLPASEMTGPASELDAENLFLLAKYPEAEKQFAALTAGAADEARRLRFSMREGQCEYFSGNYSKAADLLAPVAGDKTAATDETLQPAIFLLGDAMLQQGKNAEAAEALKKFVSVAKSDKSEAEFKLALAQLRAGDVSAAQATLTQLSQQPADSQWVQRGLLELGQIDYKAAHPEAASDALKKVTASNPGPDLAAPAIYLLGWIDFDAKHYPEAAAQWKEVAEKYPTQPIAADAGFQQGVALKEAGKLDDAFACLQAFADSHAGTANAAKARQLAAACLTAQGKNDEAGKMLAALASDPKAAGSDTLLYDLAWSQRNTKDSAGATATYARLLKEHPDSKLANATRTESAELLYADKKYADAQPLLEAVVADKNADPKVLTAAQYRLGWCYSKLGFPDKAAATFAEFATAHADSELAPSALLQAGMASAEQQKFEEARASFTKMLAQSPDNPQAPIALLKLGEVQAELSDYDGSLKSNTTFLDRYPKDQFAYRARFGAAWAMENLKKYDQAREAYQAVIAATNGETAARSQFQIGETYLEEQKFEQAVPALLAVEDVYAYPKWSARALLEAGRAFEQLKQDDQARQQYTQLVAKYKDAPEASLAQDRLKSIKGPT